MIEKLISLQQTEYAEGMITTFEFPGPGSGPWVLLSDRPELPAKFSSQEYFSAPRQKHQNSVWMLQTRCNLTQLPVPGTYKNFDYNCQADQDQTPVKTQSNQSPKKSIRGFCKSLEENDAFNSVQSVHHHILWMTTEYEKEHSLYAHCSKNI